MNNRVLLSVIDFLPDATFVIDMNGIVRAWNKAMEKMTGISGKDILGKGNKQYAVPFYGEQRPILIDFILGKYPGAESAYDYIRSDGAAIYAEIYAPLLHGGKGAHLWGTAAPLLDTSGVVQGAVESVRDITVIKEAQKALLLNEKKYRTLFDSVHDAIFIYDLGAKKIIDINNRMCDLYGYTREEALLKDPADFNVGIYPYTSGEAYNWILKTVSAGPQTFEWKAKDSRGHIFWVEVNMHRIPIGDHDCILINVRDIEERKEAEELLEKQKHRFFTLIEEAPFGIMLINKDGRYTYLNVKFRNMFGYDLKDIPDGRTWFKKAFPDARMRHNVIRTWVNDIDKFATDPSLRESNRWIWSVTCKDQTQKMINFICVALPSDEYLITLEDITSRKTAEEQAHRWGVELDAQSRHLEEVNSALKVLLKERDNDQKQLEDKIVSNVKGLVMPYIEKLKRCRLDSSHMTYVDIIETNLGEIISPFLQKMGLKYARLTPTEIEIANLVKNGKRTKEIGDLLHMSQGAINFHRNNIRKKLGIIKKQVNLRSYLLSI